MNLLYIIPYAPTPIRTRPYHLIREVARRGHNVTLATVWENAEEAAFLQSFCHSEGIHLVGSALHRVQKVRNTGRAMATGRPVQALYSWEPQVARAITARLNESRNPIDLIHIEHLRGAHYGLSLVAALESGFSNPRPALVWDSVDCISSLFEQASELSRSVFGRLIARFELNRTRQLEGELLERFSTVIVTSKKDRADLLALHSDQNESFTEPDIRIIPNGVDLRRFYPIDEPYQSDTIVFSGKMSYHANITAALHLIENIMPRVWAHRRNVRVGIVGKDPDRQLCQIAENEHRVEVTGRVKALRPYLAAAAVAVAPMPYGVGIQNKVLEAMACRTPVVASKQAASALTFQTGNEMLVAENPDDFARKILTLLEDPGVREQYAEAGFEFVKSCYRWSQVVEKLEDVYYEVISAAR